MIQRISWFFTQAAPRALPHPLISSIFVAIATFVLAFGLTPQAPGERVLMWGFGFWNLLAFSMRLTVRRGRTWWHRSGHRRRNGRARHQGLLRDCGLLFAGAVFAAGLYLF
ncbi:Short chain fatty acid transporter [Cupriavidus sp. YR651]|uniref:TIGR00366 family protein n=1 Tax=Cupriavidus sp. YR651 TaxID=1855315 RepID=UPI00088C4918|nr:TIGR00366 family protein [Cupriavidus sp. YR651]SDD00016.1 Short chain fatty acid transporter [Cupriavidus sp. YR651]